ncbi:hypothetical protein G3N95_33230 [Paraburkholderia sp. Tr-20389]|uniref:hypothetical protein n=1 Tax=Paraburkholderia sp. Tr-20389 TaxID=2703903 RepID=UPI00197FFDA9|nr:hypothetical protein [Paraburkholderia sp. Tr-20389]MBN3757825.1 hypothetical protein [Paraburkholderia sp. Tr-20389]
MSTTLQHAHRDVVRTENELREFEATHLFTVSNWDLKTQNPFAPYRYLTDLSLGEAQRTEDRAKHESSPRIESRNLWMELRGKMHDVLAEIEANAEAYKYMSANRCTAAEKDKINPALDKHITREHNLLNSIRSMLHEYLSSVAHERESLFLPAIEATKIEIERIRQNHHLLLNTYSTAQAELARLQALLVEEKFAAQPARSIGNFIHISERARLPSAGAVYVITRDEIMYVGQSGNIRTRMAAHFSSGYYKDKDLVSILNAENERDRLQIEAKLIETLGPKLNKK